MEKATASLGESRIVRLMLLRRSRLRRKGSLAAAVAQSMALAVLGTAAAYPIWVLVEDKKRRAIVLGASWAIRQDNPAPGTPLLGSSGGPIMLAIACCCFFSVLTGSLALALDFIGARPCRSLAPLLHCVTAMMIACTAALGSCLLALIRERLHTEPELQGLSASPGQSLFLAFLSCTLASTATGFSCVSPARLEPMHSSWDVVGPRSFHGTSATSLPPLHDEALSSAPKRGHAGKVQWREYVNQLPPIFREELRRRQQQGEYGHSSGEQKAHVEGEPLAGARGATHGQQVSVKEDESHADPLFLG